eukprot:TRINITY_DN15622_c0_g1_i2.p1 TRINITY_DN15622_c0_g1~~TRINITY_DN15622_c0_g1_i2.p1  ORF type:complete len:112 (-),score=21.02 TRINITY_DN15622_c0_g1_i2:242-577(-)
MDPAMPIAAAGADGNKDHPEYLDTANVTDLDAIIDGMLAPGGVNQQYTCRACDYSSPYRARVRNHIEAKHTSHAGFLCSHCHRLYKTRHSLKVHQSASKCGKFKSLPSLLQ